ncbi:MAG: hypothetical protein J0I99_14780 [Devosia sp.]|uniref:hypothetical protein n=1 Tax=Devosia sp. TaxID=1871048 RepID=UPI001AD2A0CB|nr:hypothetical protein [Devosia sp.]MBN9317005.1 hypothetical protein [Devosia sp.]
MSNPTTGQAERQEGESYEVRLGGHLDPRWAARLDIPGLTHESDGTTMLRATGMDQAALHGLLQRVRDLGLTLISVIRVGNAADDALN